jgi:hypothetical protein
MRKGTAVVYRVFISYSTNDLPLVNKLRPALYQMRSMGVEVYIAEYNVPPGARLDEHIKSHLACCDLFCVLWSRNAKESAWVSQEIGLAEAHRRLIVPIMLDDGLPLPGFIQDRKYISACEGIECASQRLTQIINDNLHQKAVVLQQQKDKNAVAVIFLGALLFIVLAAKK